MKGNLFESKISVPCQITNQGIFKHARTKMSYHPGIQYKYVTWGIISAIEKNNFKGLMRVKRKVASEYDAEGVKEAKNN